MSGRDWQLVSPFPDTRPPTLLPSPTPPRNDPRTPSPARVCLPSPMQSQPCTRACPGRRQPGVRVVCVCGGGVCITRNARVQGAVHYALHAPCSTSRSHLVRGCAPQRRPSSAAPGGPRLAELHRRVGRHQLRVGRVQQAVVQRHEHHAQSLARQLLGDRLADALANARWAGWGGDVDEGQRRRAARRHSREGGPGTWPGCAAHQDSLVSEKQAPDCTHPSWSLSRAPIRPCTASSGSGSLVSCRRRPGTGRTARTTRTAPRRL